MPNKEFLEEYPLHRKLTIKLPVTLDMLPKPAIHMHCHVCESEQTFNMTNEYFDLFQYMNTPTKNTKVRLVYLCQSCKSFSREFYLYLSNNLDYIYKIGQYPAWEIKIDKNLDKVLGKHSANFKKGLVCESQGYGIGAFAYYRRITEEIIDELLDSIFDLIDESGKEEYKFVLDKTKTTRVTQDKIDLVKDLLPTILKPNGMNPLGVLHSELSEGMHANSDQDCLEIATHIREILTFLVNQIIQSKESAKQFTTSMKSILDKRINK
jgi:hypothetical protein